MASKTFQKIGILGLYAETPLHCGTEAAVGYIDLPIQRERHTRYPVIPGSTIKGVLKDEMKESLRDELKKYFGEVESDDKATTPGMVSFGDGIIVLFPVRSTDGPFQWVTCPHVLERVWRALDEKEKIEEPGQEKAWAKDDGTVLVEEIALKKETKEGLFENEGPLAKFLKLIPDSDGFKYTKEVLLSRLLVLNDRDFQEIVENGTEVLTRIKLNIFGTTTTIKGDEDKKLAREMLSKQLGHDPNDAEFNDACQGNMFVEEVVPPETLFLCVLRASKDNNFMAKGIPDIIRLGGDETIGRGLTHVSKVLLRESTGTKKE